MLIGPLDHVVIRDDHEVAHARTEDHYSLLFRFTVEKTAMSHDIGVHEYQQEVQS